MIFVPARLVGSLIWDILGSGPFDFHMSDLESQTALKFFRLELLNSIFQDPENVKSACKKVYQTQKKNTYSINIF